MKKLLFACMLFGAAVAVNAQDSASTASPTDPSTSTSTTTQSSSTATTTSQDNNLEKIKSQDLPEGVKKSLESQDFRGWLVSSAYKMKSAVGASDNQSTSGSASGSTSTSATGTSGANGQDIYVVELKNGAQTKTVRFDKDGKKLDDQGMGNDQDQK